MTDTPDNDKAAPVDAFINQSAGGRIPYTPDPEGESLQHELKQCLAQRSKVGKKIRADTDWRMTPKHLKSH